jgi:predicted nucleic acid-binding protein
MSEADDSIVGAVVILDANVLVPMKLTDFFLTAATEFQLLRPYVSPEIMDEVRRNLIADFPRLEVAKIDRRLRLVATHTLGSMDNPADPPTSVASYINPKDVHVVAAALHHDADVIVTNDDRFEGEVRRWLDAGHGARYRLRRAMNAKTYVEELVRESSASVARTIGGMAARMKSPPHSAAEVRDALASQLPALRSLDVE